jgi:DNA-binding NarL/FixJ family response regulator
MSRTTGVAREISTYEIPIEGRDGMVGGSETAGVRARRRAGNATDRELAVVAVADAGSEKAAAHRLDVSHSTVKHHLASAR